MAGETDAGRRLVEWAKAMDGMLGREPGLEGIRTCELVVEESVGLIEGEARERVGEALLAAGYGESLASDVGDGRALAPTRRDTRGRRVGGRVGNGRYLRGADWREIYTGLAVRWAVLLERLDLAEDATPDDILAAARREGWDAALAAVRDGVREYGKAPSDLSAESIFRRDGWDDVLAVVARLAAEGPQP